MNGRQPGDPDRAATAIVQMVLDGGAPLHFPLGAYVIKKLRDKAAALGREAEAFATIAADADYHGR